MMSKRLVQVASEENAKGWVYAEIEEDYRVHDKDVAESWAYGEKKEREYELMTAEQKEAVYWAFVEEAAREYGKEEKREYVSMTAEQKAQNQMQLYITGNDTLRIEFNDGIMQVSIDDWHYVGAVILVIDFFNRQMNPNSVAYGDRDLAGTFIG